MNCRVDNTTGVWINKEYTRPLKAGKFYFNAGNFRSKFSPQNWKMH